MRFVLLAASLLQIPAVGCAQSKSSEASPTRDGAPLVLAEWNAYASRPTFQHPRSVTVGPEGRGGSITKRAIVELDEKGNWTRDWTSAGPDRRSIVEPAGIAVDNAGYLYVTDWAVSRVVKYDPRKTP